MVSGHVDGVAEILLAARLRRHGAFPISRASALAKFIAPKGSVALDGTSLTVNAVEGEDSRSC